MKLKVVGRYRSPRGNYEVGQEIDVSGEEGRYLLADAPGCFEEAGAEVEEKALDEAPEDKMMKKAPRKKGGAS